MRAIEIIAILLAIVLVYGIVGQLDEQAESQLQHHQETNHVRPSL